MLTATKTYVRPLAFAGSLSCLVTDVVEQGAHSDPALAHSDPSLDFTHEVAISRNDVGLVTKVESVAPAGRWTLQDVAYDAEFLVTSVGAPGRGTSTFQYEPGTRLPRQVVAPTGVATQVTSRALATDALLTLQTTRGLASWQQFFTYDGQERLATRRDDLGGATALNPNERYSYQYATATTPASVYLSTLIDATSASARDQVELATSTGEAIGTVTRIPEGWAFGRLVSRSRARSEAQGALRDGAASTLSPTAMDYSALFTGTSAIDFAGTSALARTVDERTTFHAGVERQVTTAQSIAGGVLVRTATENGTNSTTSRADASRRVLTFDDEANVRYTYTYDALGRVRQVVLPDGRRHTASYDAYGRPSRIVREGISTIDITYDAVSGLPSTKRFSTPAGVLQRTVSWSYDAIGRTTREQHDDLTSGASKSYVSYYDGATPANPLANTAPGLLTAVAGDRYTKLLEHRVDGALTRRTVSLAGWRTVETTLGYTESGALAARKIRFLDALGGQLAVHDWRYGFDSFGRPAALTLNGSTFATFGYDANDLLASASFENGDALTLSYDGLTRRPVGSAQSTAMATTATAQQMNPRGLVDHEEFQAGGTSSLRRYTYSSQRFVATAGDAQHAYGYGFDGFGLPSWVDQDGTRTTIVQSGDTMAAGTLVMRFDALGRTASRGDLTLSYGPDGQLEMAGRGAKIWSFIYDEKGERRVKVEDGVPAAAYFEEGYVDANGLAEPVTIGGRVVGLVRNGAYETVATDLRGTVVAERDGTPRLASPFGHRDVHPASSVALDYVERGFDADLGLVRMGVRDYDPAVNRFTTPDPFFIEDPALCLKSPLECNLYAYARGNPLLFRDPTGRCATTANGEINCMAAPAAMVAQYDAATYEYWGRGSVGLAALSFLDAQIARVVWMAAVPFQALAEPYNATVELVNAYRSGDGRAIQDAHFRAATLLYGGLLSRELGAAASAVESAASRTNAQLVQDVANRARAWGAREGLALEGSRTGTLLHGYSERLLIRYQRMFGERGLSTEVRYFNGQLWQPGMPLKGSIKLDVVEGELNAPTTVFDYKFGGAKLTPGRIDEIRSGAGLGADVPVIEVKPQ